MGVSGFEPETSSLSVTRSNRLSYTPSIAFILYTNRVDNQYLTPGNHPSIKNS